MPEACELHARDASAPVDSFDFRCETCVARRAGQRGHVARARVLQPVPGLDEAALEAVRSWLFVPASHGGVPVATLARAPIMFSIH